MNPVPWTSLLLKNMPLHSLNQTRINNSRQNDSNKSLRKSFFAVRECFVNVQICTGPVVLVEEKLSGKNRQLQERMQLDGGRSAFTRNMPQFPLISQQTRERLPPFLSLSLSFLMHINVHIILLLFCSYIQFFYKMLN